jgi:hypothetical protein
MQDGKAYERISSHQKYFHINKNTDPIQYGYDFRPINFSCPDGNKVVYRTLLFFRLPRNRIYIKFEQFGTKKAYNLIMHGINYVRTRFDTPRNDLRKESFPPFTKNFPNNWNKNQNAINYHNNRIGREVFLSNASLIQLLESGTTNN